ncbi:kinase-like domain-containing protein [Apodospora peruviana]|uniref:Kinase-like domain-containing protein n=1 Tax=Apodospora peruviana TaxID=516989 RepID=A0AAE0HUH3_9PEZI|nr:kinase-like domain-containing protein [Apodospora peruviana]
MDAARYKSIDDAETEREKARDVLERRIVTLVEDVNGTMEHDTVSHSADVLAIKAALKRAGEWADENFFATLEEYLHQERLLDGIEESIKRWQWESSVEQVRADAHYRVLLQRLQELGQMLSTKTRTPQIESIMKEKQAVLRIIERGLSTLSQLNNVVETVDDLLVQLRDVDSTETPDVSSTEKPTQEVPRVGALADEAPIPLSDDRSEKDGSRDQALLDDAPTAVQPSQSITTTPGPSRTQSTKAAQDFDNETLESLFSRSGEAIKDPFTDAQFDRISTFLRNNTELPVAWSNVPRIYTVLRLIGQLDAMDAFLVQGMADIWFPFTTNSLPSVLRPSLQSKFLEVQGVVLSKGFRLEKGSDRKHALFSADEPLPFQVIGRLGRGAHGSVDKVMSTISHREYARKIFRKRKGLKQEDIRTFKTELDVLKRVHHWHCVELVGLPRTVIPNPNPAPLQLCISKATPTHVTSHSSWSPVGDYNLADYYHKAKGNADMLSLLRSFFGCLANANIIVKGDRVLLADFGIAYNWDNLTRGTTTADSGKTLVYAAPEVVRVEPRNESADIWSLGCVFLETATVLNGETVGNMREMFHQRSDTYCFHANKEAIAIWVAQLRRIPGSRVAESLPLDWAMSMLQAVPAERPTAAKLFEDIAEECARHGILFSGPCCHDEGTTAAGNSTTDDEDDAHLWGKDETVND